jgi:hypothetical protein
VKQIPTLLIGLALASCGTQDPNLALEGNSFNPSISGEEPVNHVAVSETPAPKQTMKPIPLHTDGLRLPSDMLGLPQDDQLRTAPGIAKEGKATVIVRPPEE